MTAPLAIVTGPKSLFRSNLGGAFGALLFGIFLLITSEMGRLRPKICPGLWVLTT
jgi:hypothetical protein